MITKEQVNQVQEWGKGKTLTDAVKQFVKCGEELAEMVGEVDLQKKYSELGDYFFTIILLSGQIGFDFHTTYLTASRNVNMPLALIEQYLMLEHLAMGGNILKGKNASYQLTKCITLAVSVANKIKCNEDYFLKLVIEKNNKKAGKTVNGTFVKAEDFV
jgi:hypothetical protein